MLDFTLQDDKGRTLKWLCRHISEDEDGNYVEPFCDLPEGVDSSAPFYLYRPEAVTVPETVETVMHKIWPLYLLFSHATFYFDLLLDYTVTKQYWRAGGCVWRLPWNDEVVGEVPDLSNQCGNHGAFMWWLEPCDPDNWDHWPGDLPGCEVDPQKSVYVVYSIFFFLIGIVITCAFDAITTLVTAKDRRWDSGKWGKLGFKCLLNMFYLRLPYEAWWRAFRAWSPTVVVDGKEIEKTPRMPPMSWDQVKCSEGIFEALPQSMLQAFVVINDLYRGREVTAIQALSLLTSYGSVAFVLGMMGPPNIRMGWRVVFMAFVVVNVVLRSMAFSFLTILDNENKAFAIEEDSQYNGWWGNVAYYYLLASFIVTGIFIFGLQKKALNLSSIILALIAFMCPVDISQFTVLKTAQPRSPQLPFAVVRYMEIIVICTMFVSTQEAIPVIPMNVQNLDLVFQSNGVNTRLVRSPAQTRIHGLSLVCVRSCIALTVLRMVVACLVPSRYCSSQASQYVLPLFHWRLLCFLP
jgi:hypothetical protein